jgi:translation initiation factor 1 (eIF-1/SUI1)
MNNTTDLNKDNLNNNDFSDSDSDDQQQDNKSEMSDFDDINIEDLQNSNNILKSIDRNLSIKYIKNGRNSRTYLTGIKSYITEDDKLEDFVKKLKKQLGAGGLINKEENVVSFMGDHTRKIYEYIVKNNICPKHEIKD